MTTMGLRELDLAIFEAFGGVKSFQCKKCRGAHFGTYRDKDGSRERVVCHDQFERGCKWSGTWDEMPVPEVSRYDTLAFILADKLIREGECLTLSYQCGIFRGAPTDMGWYADFRVSESRAAGETRAEAICRAALKVHERKLAKDLV